MIANLDKCQRDVGRQSNALSGNLATEKPNCPTRALLKHLAFCLQEPFHLSLFPSVLNAETRMTSGDKARLLYGIRQTLLVCIGSRLHDSA